ncbi:MAG: class I SAM-dependent methyltransferase [Polyangiaceae bacterium]
MRPQAVDTVAPVTSTRQNLLELPCSKVSASLRLGLLIVVSSRPERNTGGSEAAILAPMPTRGHPLDYQSHDYRYIERVNASLVSLVERHLFASNPAARLLDIGAGAGANLRELQRRAPGAHFTAIEPNPRAVELLKQACSDVHVGTLDGFLAQRAAQRFDGIVLSDVLEHLADPVAMLRRLLSEPSLAGALIFVSLPNYAVWYNRAATLLGRFEYSWSGLYDRTHLRFFTRGSQNKLFSQLGLEVVEQRATPSLAQSMAPWLRRSFESAVDAGEHLALDGSVSYRAYARFVEPVETRVCEVWPALLGFQIVSVLRPR